MLLKVKQGKILLCSFLVEINSFHIKFYYRSSEFAFFSFRFLGIHCSVVAKTAMFYSILDHEIMLDLILNIVSYYACFWSCLHEADCSGFLCPYCTLPLMKQMLSLPFIE